MPKTSSTGDIDWTQYSLAPPSTTGPQGAVGSTYFDVTTGNLSVNTGPSWVTAASTYHVNSTNHYTVAGAALPPDITLQRPGKPNIKVGETLDAIMERLCIIIPAMDKLEKYPALKEAYENYKLIEALIQNDESEDNK